MKITVLEITPTDVDFPNNGIGWCQFYNIATPYDFGIRYSPDSLIARDVDSSLLTLFSRGNFYRNKVG